VDEGLKKRLLGAAVLASLVVIFVPMLIDDPVDTGPELRAIPTAPPQKEFASSMLSEEVVPPEPLPVRRFEPEPEPVLRELEEPVVAEKPEPVAPPVTAGPKEGLTAWVVKVGSFSSRDNANALVKKLRDAGFQTPDAERIQLHGKVLYRVSVGPMVRKEKAEALLPKVDKVSGTKGQVSRYR
jgi:DedD protein